MPRVAIPTPRVIIKRKGKTEKFGYLFLSFRWNGNFLTYNLSDKVEYKYWDAKAGRTVFNKKHGQTYIDLNKKLDDLRHFVSELYNKQPTISKENLKLEIGYYLGKQERPREDGEKNLTLMEFIEQFIHEEKNKPNSNKNTCKKYTTVYGNLKKYIAEKKKSLDWQDINWQFRDDFEKWMFAEPRAFSVNTAAKLMKVIKQFMNIGLKRKYHNFTVHKETGFGIQEIALESKLTLTFDELKQLIKLDLSKNPRQEKVRDLFVIGCYTGLRFSDWHKINKKQVVSEDGDEYLEILTTKTRQLVVIPILPELETMLKKYDYQLPKCSAQEFNRIIKEVCKPVLDDKTYLKTYSKGGQKLSENRLRWKDVTSHCARRSFATNFYELGIPPSDLMLITGHATEKQFFEYIVLDKKKQAKRFKMLVARQSKERYLESLK